VAATGQKAKGYYSGQPGRQTDNPSGQRILETVTRQRLTLFGSKTRTGTEWQLAPLPEIVKQILGFLGLSKTLSTSLILPQPTAVQRCPSLRPRPVCRGKSRIRCNLYACSAN